MKLKQLILSSIALGALAFTVGMAQPAHAAIGMESPAPAQNLEKPASVMTQHHINVDGKVLEPVKDFQNVAYVNGQPLVALRQVSEALGYKVAWDTPTKTALVDMNIATLAIQPDSAEVVRHGKLKIINLDTSESFLPAARKVDGTIFVKPQVFKLLLNQVNITKDEIFIAPQRAQLASTTNTEVSHKNELNTFLPPSQKDVKKKEDPKATEKPLIKIKKSLAKDTVTTNEPTTSTDVSEYSTVFIPITSPLPFSKAPPLLPGLMAALVWSNVIVLSVNATSLLTALITPVVTDWPYPKALPMAIALSPAFN